MLDSISEDTALREGWCQEIVKRKERKSHFDLWWFHENIAKRRNFENTNGVIMDQPFGSRTIQIPLHLERYTICAHLKTVIVLPINPTHRQFRLVWIHDVDGDPTAHQHSLGVAQPRHHQALLSHQRHHRRSAAFQTLRGEKKI